MYSEIVTHSPDSLLKQIMILLEEIQSSLKILTFVIHQSSCMRLCKGPFKLLHNTHEWVHVGGWIGFLSKSTNIVLFGHFCPGSTQYPRPRPPSNLCMITDQEFA